MLQQLLSSLLSVDGHQRSRVPTQPTAKRCHPACGHEGYYYFSPVLIFQVNIMQVQHSHKSSTKNRILLTCVLTLYATKAILKFCFRTSMCRGSLTSPQRGRSIEAYIYIYYLLHYTRRTVRLPTGTIHRRHAVGSVSTSGTDGGGEYRCTCASLNSKRLTVRSTESCCEKCWPEPVSRRR